MIFWSAKAINFSPVFTVSLEKLSFLQYSKEHYPTEQSVVTVSTTTLIRPVFVKKRKFLKFFEAQ